MPVLSDGELAAVVVAAGWSGRDAVIAFSVARAESSGIPERVGRVDKDDLGLFQINRRYYPEVDRINWRDPLTNARLAHDIQTRSGWGQWVTFKNGSYLRYMGIAETAIKKNPGGTIPIPSHPGFGGLPGVDQFSALLNFLQLLGDRHTWIRIGEIIAGIFLVAFGALRLAEPVVKPLTKAAIKAAVVAA